MFKIIVLVVVFTAIFYSIRGYSTRPKNPCKYVLCSYGTYCVNKERQCRAESCPLIAVCEAHRQFPNFCSLPASAGRCPKSFPVERRWFYNSTSGRCETFAYGGCAGNENNFLSYMHCERSCVRHEECFLKKETGPCRAQFVRWYYDIFTGACREFVFGGCQGNGNNFPTFDACMSKCFVTEFDNRKLRQKIFKGEV